MKMSQYDREIRRKLNKSLKDPLNRMNHTYSILCAKRSRMEDDDPRKNGVMLDRLRVLEEKIREFEKSDHEPDPRLPDRAENHFDQREHYWEMG